MLAELLPSEFEIIGLLRSCLGFFWFWAIEDEEAIKLCADRVNRNEPKELVEAKEQDDQGDNG